MTTLALPTSSPFYSGELINPDVPGLYDIGIAGRGYKIDPKQTVRAVLPRLRDASDTEATPGEASLSTKGLWHRIQRAWQFGQGQRMFDSHDDNSDRRRYYRGLNVDPWTPNQLSMLPGTSQNGGITITGFPYSIVVAGYLYVGQDNSSTVKFTSNPAAATWTSCTGISGTCTGITTDGVTVWVATTTGIYQTSAGSSVFVTLASSTTVKAIGYVNGRLLVSAANALSEVSSTGTITALVGGTHRSNTFVWSVITSSPEFIYVSGIMGDRSEVYRISTDSSTGDLNAPVITCALPVGEYLVAMGYYVGMMWFGTSKGLRKATMTLTGNLQYGRVIQTGACYSLAFEGNFVWFTWNTYLDGYLGVGRAHAGDETDTQVPVFASDLMTLGSNLVYRVHRFQGHTYFINAGGFFGETVAVASTGWFDTGWIDFGLPYPKTLIDLDLRHQPLHGTIQINVIGEDEQVHAYDSTTVQGSVGPDDPIPLGADRFDRFRVKFIFTPTSSLGPVLLRWTLRAKPAPANQDQILLAILMGRGVAGGADGNQEIPYNTWTEYQALKELSSSRVPVYFQMGLLHEQVTVEDVRVQPNQLDSADTEDPFFDGILFVTLNTVEAS